MGLYKYLRGEVVGLSQGAELHTWQIPHFEAEKRRDYPTRYTRAWPNCTYH